MRSKWPLCCICFNAPSTITDIALTCHEIAIKVIDLAVQIIKLTNFIDLTNNWLKLFPYETIAMLEISFRNIAGIALLCCYFTQGNFIPVSMHIDRIGPKFSGIPIFRPIDVNTTMPRTKVIKQRCFRAFIDFQRLPRCTSLTSLTSLTSCMSSLSSVKKPRGLTSLHLGATGL